MVDRFQGAALPTTRHANERVARRIRLSIFVRLILVALTVLSVTFSADAAEVEVCAPDSAPEVIQEALVRVRAELRAAGFSVEPSTCGQVAVDVGRIEFTPRESNVEIRATSIVSGGTMIQHADLRQPAMSAEVIAVRAVEALRAVLLQSLRSGELKEAGISKSLRDFTQFGLEPDASSATTPHTDPSPPPPSDPLPRTVPQTEGKRLKALLSFGPAVTVYPGAPAWTLGLETRGIVHYQGASLGVVGHVSLLPGRFSLGDGLVKAQSWSILLRPGVSLPCGPKWECHLGVLAGIYQVLFSTDAASTGSSDTRHQSWTVQGDAMVGRFFGLGLGAMLQVRAGTLINAPHLVSSRSDETINWGRPLIATSFVLAYRL